MIKNPKNKKIQKIQEIENLVRRYLNKFDTQNKCFISDHCTMRLSFSKNGN